MQEVNKEIRGEKKQKKQKEQQKKKRQKKKREAHSRSPLIRGLEVGCNSSKDYLEGEEVTRKYLKTIGQTLENLRKKGYLPQTSPLDADVHNIHPGDWVLIKTWTNIPLTPKFEGPYQVLLTTHTAVCTEEKGWTHITRVKGPVPPPGENPSSAPSPDETEWTVTPHPKDLKLTFKKKSWNSEIIASPRQPEKPWILTRSSKLPLTIAATISSIPRGNLMQRGQKC
ncbi:hypothetical protein DUI87_21576 [Hirundo rustica rustica]|uniref:Murine leukemia virus integrase C-terminal domain-containing protein n=1 Tax=Hirundo rustica rustica TaxID=333673 RepID=A0A3M0JN56_HIRRU|nr:hypothetical protein DUI87_21576 [Hirundo rustica rustica]